MGSGSRGRGFLGLFRRRRADELAQIDAEITAFGEALARYEFTSALPSGPTADETANGTADETALADYGRALDAYERAKRDFVGDRDRADAEDVVRALAKGRHALARAEARRAGRPVPDQRPPCFFDPRHGPATTEFPWSPPDGVTRPVPVCAADAARLSDGLPPATTARRPDRRPSRAARPAAPRPAAVQPPPAGGAGAPWRPYKTPPPGTRTAHRAEGRGEREVRLHRPDPAEPALLVIRSSYEGEVHLVDGAGGPGGSTLVMPHALERTMVLLPPDGGEHVRLRVEKRGPWQLWLQSLEHVPVLERSLSFKGRYVFRHEGGPAAIRFSHRGSGSCWVEELTGELTAGARLVSGKGTCDLTGELPGPGLFRVRANHDWSLTRRT
ncbi:hypothetical protein [Kitasatospora cineracea]|uniref:hypothetical protein n=1 Tax=Kitasatospora cineracea TaxID=88074 RepID=UPI0036C64CD4